MTNLEYIRQLPGMEDAYPDIYGDAENPPTLCPHWAGLDNNAGGCNGCKGCYLADATIGGKPAPYLFPCPVKPGQKVYFVRYFNGASEDEVTSVTFYEEDGEIKWEAFNDVDECFGNGTGNPTKWNEEVFATREEAEKAFKEMLTDDK